MNRRVVYYATITLIIMAMFSLPWLHISSNLMDYLSNLLLTFSFLAGTLFKISELKKKHGKVGILIFFAFLFLIVTYDTLAFFDRKEWHHGKLVICILFLASMLVWSWPQKQKK